MWNGRARRCCGAVCRCRPELTLGNHSDHHPGVPHPTALPRRSPALPSVASCTSARFRFARIAPHAAHRSPAPFRVPADIPQMACIRYRTRRRPDHVPGNATAPLERGGPAPAEKRPLPTKNFFKKLVDKVKMFFGRCTRQSASAVRPETPPEAAAGEKPARMSQRRSYADQSMNRRGTLTFIEDLNVPSNVMHHSQGVGGNQFAPAVSPVSARHTAETSGVSAVYGAAPLSVNRPNAQHASTQGTFIRQYASGLLPLDPAPRNPFAADPHFDFLRAPTPPDDVKRLSKIAEYELLATSDLNFDGIIEITKAAFQTESCVISIILSKEWFQSYSGVEKSLVNRELAFCGHTILMKDADCFVVCDARTDWRFAKHPLVIGPPYVRFYAGCPLQTNDGYDVGVFSVSDSKPREFSEADRRVLADLASMGMRELGLTKQNNIAMKLQRNQEAIAKFFQQAICRESVKSIYDDAVLQIARTLGMEIAFIVEVPDLNSPRRCILLGSAGMDVSAVNGDVSLEAQRSRGYTRSVSLAPRQQGGATRPRTMSMSGKRRKSRGLSEIQNFKTLAMMDDIFTSLDKSISDRVSPNPPVTNDMTAGGERDSEISHSFLADFLYPEARGYCVTLRMDSQSSAGVPFNLRRFQYGFDYEQEEMKYDGFTPRTNDDFCEQRQLEAISAEVPRSVFLLGAFTKNPLAAIGRHLIDALNCFGSAISAAAAHHKIQTALRLNEEEMRKEKEVLSALVNNILPPSYVERLKSDQGAVADSLPDCSIVFADIVGFTAKSCNMDANELVKLLNKVFIRFDLISKLLGVEKIKTIGDCYMAGAGVPESKENHAELAAEFALALLASLRFLNAKRGTDISIRIGINSGPLVAGVIGMTKFAYDVWGNTVNIAQRMQSGSDPGRINVSEETYEQLKDKYRFTSRGSYQVKGAGEKRMYFLDSRIIEERDSEGLLREERMVSEIEEDVVEATNEHFRRLMKPSDPPHFIRSESGLGAVLESLSYES